MKDPCWKDYKMVGTKDKGGKKVPNCIKKESFKEWLEIEESEKPFKGYDGNVNSSSIPI